MLSPPLNDFHACSFPSRYTFTEEVAELTEDLIIFILPDDAAPEVPAAAAAAEQYLSTDAEFAYYPRRMRSTVVRWVPPSATPPYRGPIVCSVFDEHGEIEWVPSRVSRGKFPYKFWAEGGGLEFEELYYKGQEGDEWRVPEADELPNVLHRLLELEQEAAAAAAEEEEEGGGEEEEEGGGKKEREGMDGESESESESESEASSTGWGDEAALVRAAILLPPFFFLLTRHAPASWCRPRRFSWTSVAATTRRTARRSGRQSTPTV